MGHHHSTHHHPSAGGATVPYAAVGLHPHSHLGQQQQQQHQHHHHQSFNPHVLAAAAAAAMNQSRGERSSENEDVSRNGKNSQFNHFQLVSLTPTNKPIPSTGQSATLTALNQLSCNPHSTTSPKVSPTIEAADQPIPPPYQSLHSQLQSSPQQHHHSKQQADARTGILLTRTTTTTMDSNNNVDDEERGEDDEDDEQDNGSDNNISVTSSPVAVRSRTATASIDEENEATNIIITNTTPLASPPGENGLLRRKSEHHSSSPPPTTVGAFTSLIQRNSDTFAKHGHYLKTSDLLAGFSTAATTGAAAAPTIPPQSTFNPSLAAQLFLQTSQPLLPPPSQWLYTQLYGANYGDFSWFRNSLSGASSAFRSISGSATAASVSPGGDEGKLRSHSGRGSDGERSLDRMSPPVTSTSKRSPSPSGEDGNVTEEEADVRQPLAKKLDTLGAFTRAAVGAGEKAGAVDVWRPY